MDQSEALATAETALRSIVRHLLGDAWQELLRPNQLDKAQDRRRKEPAQRPGALETDDLLSYVDTPDLTGLVMGQWSTFAPVFQSDTRTQAAFDTLNVYRRRVAHNRPLLTFERDLLSGISGLVRNQVAIFMQKQQPVPSFYAQIATAVDQEGRAGDMSGQP